MQRVVFAALAGLCATMAMTAAVRRGSRLLPSSERYPLPPREIVGRVSPTVAAHQGQTATVLAHFGFGAFAGAGYAFFPPRFSNGALYGIAVWTASYFGWIPALHVLAPASLHPGRRNLLMVAGHVVWGATLAACRRELEQAAVEIFPPGPARDALPLDR